MLREVSIRRTRGVVSGVALILLGAWGGLAPFIGPYLHFGYTPDTAWAYNTGRLYFSVLPGAAALVGGLMVVLTRHRAVGVAGGLLGALGGLWFIIGSGVTAYLIKASVSAGLPFGASQPPRQAGSLTAYAFTVKEYLEVLALFTALGAVIIFFGALACGRMSLITARDAAAVEGYYGGPGSAEPGYAEPGGESTTGQFPTVSGHFPGGTRPSIFQPASEEYPEEPAGEVPDKPSELAP